MKNRSRLDIISGILRVTSSEVGATKTQIMYGVYLSFFQAKEYLTLLTERGLICYEQGSQRYKTTENGSRFLRTAERLESLLGLETRADNTNDSLPLRSTPPS